MTPGFYILQDIHLPSEYFDYVRDNRSQMRFYVYNLGEIDIDKISAMVLLKGTRSPNRCYALKCKPRLNLRHIQQK